MQVKDVLPYGRDSLAGALLRRVLSIYCLLTLLITAIQVVAQYNDIRSDIRQDLRMTFASVRGSLVNAFWQLDMVQTESLLQGLVGLPSISGVILVDEDGKLVEQKGGDWLDTGQASLYVADDPTDFTSSGRFGVIFPLYYELPVAGGRKVKMGSLTVITREAVILQRLKVSLLFMVLNALVKTTLLVILMLVVARKLLSDPLTKMTRQIGALDLDKVGSLRLTLGPKRNRDELTFLTDSFNQMLDKLALAKKHQDSYQRDLEQEVRAKTDYLESALRNLSIKNRQIGEMLTAAEQREDQLKVEMQEREIAQQKLKESHEALEVSLDQLKKTQDELVLAEKMASLGGLVAGVAHEINTPVGTTVTAVTHLQDRLTKLARAYQDQSLSREDLEQFLRAADEGFGIINRCLEQTTVLVRNFKQVAVDRSTEAHRTIDFGDYLQQVITTLKPRLKKTPHQVVVDCPPELLVNCRPGEISQVLTNLVMNSLIHGLDAEKPGTISIQVRRVGKEVEMIFADDGKGVPKELQSKLFDPFFTTKRDQGGTGLGTHILFNIVTQSLHGSVRFESDEGQGLKYFIRFPISVPEAA